MSILESVRDYFASVYFIHAIPSAWRDRPFMATHPDAWYDGPPIRRPYALVPLIPCNIKRIQEIMLDLGYWLQPWTVDGEMCLMVASL